MEAILPIAALGGLYVISRRGGQKKESFSTVGQTPIRAPGEPIAADSRKDLGRRFASANHATDTYLNQNGYEKAQAAHGSIGSTIQEQMRVTGDYSDTNFAHNNMVPFTRGNPHGQIYNNDHAATILDTYSGAGTQMKNKVEQAPLFKPQDNIQWANGMPATSDFMQSRVVPPTNNSMVKPFTTQQVGPGLNKGFEVDGSNGLNSGLEARDKWLPKTVDELRVVTNPKETFTLDGHQGPAAGQVKNRGQIGVVEKYRPDTFFVNSQDRWLTTTGAEKAPRTIGTEAPAASRRGVNDTYQPGVAMASNTASVAPSNYIIREEDALGEPQMGPAAATYTAPHFNDKTLLHNSHSNHNTHRSTTGQPRTFGAAFSNVVGAAIAPLMDVLRPTRKEETACNMRLYGNLAVGVPMSEVRNAGDVPDHTIREDTLYASNGFIGNQGDALGGYTVANPQSVYTQRTTTGTADASQALAVGGAGSAYGIRLEDADRSAPVNDVRESVMGGRTNTGNISVFNNQINMSTPQRDEGLQVNRSPAPHSITNTGGRTMAPRSGRPQANSYTNDCTVNDRINPEIMSALKSNPYAFPYNSVA
jgi:hypothetical protein